MASDGGTQTGSGVDDVRDRIPLREVSADDYHADRVHDTRPTLSCSIAKLLIDKSPAHARVAHPKLNPDFKREEEDKFNVGTVAHEVFLENDLTRIAVLPFDNYQTKAAQATRDESRALGLTPILAKQAEEVWVMVEALRAQCDSHPEGPFFTDGTAEKTLCWEDEFGVLCRARLDWLRDDLTAWHDLKTTKASASPDAWSRTALNIGVDLQAAFYARGCRAVLGCDPEFRFVAVETTPPFAMSVFSLAPDTIALAEKKISWALKTWAMCLRNDAWPAYDSRVAHITTPPWLEAQWLEKEERDAA